MSFTGQHCNFREDMQISQNRLHVDADIRIEYKRQVRSKPIIASKDTTASAMFVMLLLSGKFLDFYYILGN